jgi:hypothetical protein
MVMRLTIGISLTFLMAVSTISCGSSTVGKEFSMHVISNPSHDAVDVMTEVSKLPGKQMVLIQPTTRQLDITIYVTVKQGNLRMGTSNGDSLTWFPNGKVKRLSGGVTIDYQHRGLPGAGLILRPVDPGLGMTSIDRLDGKPIDFAKLENAIDLQKDTQGRIVLEIEPSGDFQGEWTIRRFSPQ